MISSVPDLLTGFGLQRGGAEMRQRMEDVSVEITTGRAEDLYAASGGDLARLYAIEDKLGRLTARGDRLALADARAEASQNALADLEASLGTLGLDITGALGLGDIRDARIHGDTARDAFSAAVTALNSSFAGRSLFAGAATDSAALADGEVMLAQIALAVDATTTVADALTAIDDYFNAAGGGFETGGFLGDAADAPAVELGNDTRLAYGRRGDEAEIRSVLQGLATLVIGVEHPIATAGLVETEAVLAAGATRLIGAADGITDIRAALGSDQARIEDALTRTAAERSATEIARAKMVTRDPYEAASEFQALEAQMQSVYAVTARLAGLSLTNFLR